MKRKWRIGRVVLGIILLGAASLLSWRWPHRPLWHLSLPVGHQLTLVGFDEAQGLLLATRQDGVSQQLHSYRLGDGSVWSTQTINLAGPRPELPWPCALLPRGHALLLCSGMATSFHVLPLPPGPPLCTGNLQEEGNLTITTGVGYSNNGTAFVVHGFGLSGDELSVYDLASARDLPTPE